MTIGHKVGIGFVLTAFVVGFFVPFDNLSPSAHIAVLALAFVVLFAVFYWERARGR